MQDGVGIGAPGPLGVTPDNAGVNVAVHSAHAEAIHLCLFDENGAEETRRIRLPVRTGDVFHGHIAGVQPGMRYGLRAEGPWRPEDGHRFNPAKLLVDPYALALDRPFTLDHALFDARRLGQPFDAVDSAPFVPKAIVTAPAPIAARLARPITWRRQVIYELHVRGFTKLNPDIPEALRGTFAGLAHPAAIAHLKALGITMVELLPVAAWLDERHLPPLGLNNYWGYNPIAYCAPDPRLAPGGLAEIRDCVAALHEADIAVILDVVFNHSGESDELGPTVSMRGLDNASYYRLWPDDRRYYTNEAGCGNVLAVDRPAVLRLVMDALRIWVERTGIDGFRFDLATTLARRADGFDPAAPFLAAMEQDPLLRDLILIAEPWDVGMGGYQLGRFPPGWGEWNDRYRDTMRRFFRGDAGMLGELATRVAGSADIFAGRHRPLSRSVNFVTAHDGFTLADLVSYERKENHANGERNRDGTDDNKSWNNGVEGPTDDPAIIARRRADMAALLAALIFSRGTPMLSMGDELARSQNGNNNAYAQDGPIAWLDWAKADRDLFDFACRIIERRAAHPALHDPRPLTGRATVAGDAPDVSWLDADGAELDVAGWNAAEARTLLIRFHAAEADDQVLVLLHAGAEAKRVTFPVPRPGRAWHVAIDSAVLVPVPRETVTSHLAQPRSVVLVEEIAIPPILAGP
ncbi:glycogen debranching protein GlgX [Kaistia dalseonensis]|uniref:Glycogen operon protein n=1 Tax=Kaistia dalseonensis TaxID=410840 RepID=A0ABU0H8C7_9HYPH|nr:glycogen debranching protein GlgX [Kaistia dalseonensis]MCX5495970.1 glycogen debranching protein GlgX [Kaistia dalseonensis]MDQ0438573.1 glycogen operon protein [Kaistia dalseonensis]